MSQETVEAEIVKILTDETLSREEQINRLDKMRSYVRAEMRAATESSMVVDNDIGPELKQLDEALERLGYTAVSTEDSGGATL